MRPIEEIFFRWKSFDKRIIIHVPRPPLLVRPLEVPAKVHDVRDDLEEGEPVVLQRLVPLSPNAVAGGDHKVRAHQVEVHRKGAVVWGGNRKLGLRGEFA